MRSGKNVKGNKQRAVNMEGLGGALVSLFGIAVLASVIKTFTDPKTGKKVEYELHSTHKDRKAAMEESRDLRADGQRARFTKAGDEFKVWVSKKTSDMMSWPYN